MTHDDHAALIEIRNRLEELRAQREEARDGSNWSQFRELQAEIDSVEGARIEIMRRTSPEDIPKLFHSGLYGGGF
jgi:hypothetical protein